MFWVQKILIFIFFVFKVLQCIGYRIPFGEQGRNTIMMSVVSIESNISIDLKIILTIYFSCMLLVFTVRETWFSQEHVLICSHNVLQIDLINITHSTSCNSDSCFHASDH